MGACEAIANETVNVDVSLFPAQSPQTAAAEVQRDITSCHRAGKTLGDLCRKQTRCSEDHSAFPASITVGISVAREVPDRSQMMSKKDFQPLGLHPSRSSKIRDQSHLSVSLNSVQSGPHQQLSTGGTAHKC